MDNNRIKERRSWRHIPEVPFMDDRGEVVTADRRRNPDRRLNSIEVQWLESYPRLWSH